MNSLAKKLLLVLLTICVGTGLAADDAVYIGDGDIAAIQLYDSQGNRLEATSEQASEVDEGWIINNPDSPVLLVTPRGTIYIYENSLIVTGDLSNLNSELYLVKGRATFNTFNMEGGSLTIYTPVSRFTLIGNGEMLVLSTDDEESVTSFTATVDAYNSLTGKRRRLSPFQKLVMSDRTGRLVPIETGYYLTYATYPDITLARTLREDLEQKAIAPAPKLPRSEAELLKAPKPIQTTVSILPFEAVAPVVEAVAPVVEAVVPVVEAVVPVVEAVAPVEEVVVPVEEVVVPVEEVVAPVEEVVVPVVEVVTPVVEAVAPVVEAVVPVVEAVAPVVEVVVPVEEVVAPVEEVVAPVEEVVAPVEEAVVPVVPRTPMITRPIVSQEPSAPVLEEIQISILTPSAPTLEEPMTIAFPAVPTFKDVRTKAHIPSTVVLLEPITKALVPQKPSMPSVSARVDIPKRPEIQETQSTVLVPEPPAILVEQTIEEIEREEVLALSEPQEVEPMALEVADEETSLQTRPSILFSYAENQDIEGSFGVELGYAFSFDGTNNDALGHQVFVKPYYAKGPVSIKLQASIDTEDFSNFSNSVIPLPDTTLDLLSYLFSYIDQMRIGYSSSAFYLTLDRTRFIASDLTTFYAPKFKSSDNLVLQNKITLGSVSLLSSFDDLYLQNLRANRHQFFSTLMLFTPSEGYPLTIALGTLGKMERNPGSVDLYPTLSLRLPVINNRTTQLSALLQASAYLPVYPNIDLDSFVDTSLASIFPNYLVSLGMSVRHNQIASKVLVSLPKGKNHSIMVHELAYTSSDISYQAAAEVTAEVQMIGDALQVQFLWNLPLTSNFTLSTLTNDPTQYADYSQFMVSYAKNAFSIGLGFSQIGLFSSFEKAIQGTESWQYLLSGDYATTFLHAGYDINPFSFSVKAAYPATSTANTWPLLSVLAKVDLQKRL